jgi:protein N-lysine methyltransferase METTL21D
VQLHWNCPAHLVVLATPRRFNLVVATDIVYVQESVLHLVAAMDTLADAERNVVLLGYQIRSPEAQEAFWNAVSTAFPVIEKVMWEHLDPDELAAVATIEPLSLAPPQSLLLFLLTTLLDLPSPGRVCLI